MFAINLPQKRVVKHGYLNNKNGESTLHMIVQET